VVGDLPLASHVRSTRRDFERFPRLLAGARTAAAAPTTARRSAARPLQSCAPARSRPRSDRRSEISRSVWPAPVASTPSVVLDAREDRGIAPVVEHRLAQQLELDGPYVHSTVRTRTWWASKSLGGRVWDVAARAVRSRHGPIRSASRTTAQPVGVIHVVSRSSCPARSGGRPGRPSSPARSGSRAVRSRIAANTAASRSAAAQPLDGPVRGEQRARVAVRQEGVVGDRRERRALRRAVDERRRA